MFKIKKIFSCVILTAILSAFCCITASADAVCNLNVSPKKAGVGEEINVKIEFTNDQMDLLNAKATLEYDSSVIEVSENSSIQGAGGVIALSDMAGDAPSITFDITFVAKAVGQTNISVTNANVSNTDGEITEINSVSETVEVTQEGGFISDSKLQSLEISEGFFEKGFSPEVTSYEVNVENDITSIEIKAQMSSVKSYIYFSGFSENDISFVEDSSPRIYVAKTSLAEGENVKKITVEAENGEETVYTINIVRLAKDVIAPLEPDDSQPDDSSQTDDSSDGMNIFQTKPVTSAQNSTTKNPNNDKILSKIFPVFIVLVFAIAIILLLVVFVAKLNVEKQKKKRKRPSSSSTYSPNSAPKQQTSPQRNITHTATQPKKAVVRKKTNNSNVRRPK